MKFNIPIKSIYSSEIEYATITFIDHKLCVSIGCTNRTSLLDSKQLPSKNSPIYENLIFDFKTGTTHVLYKYIDSEIILQEDLTNDYNIANKIGLFDIIFYNKLVLQKIISIYEDYFNISIPFKASELNKENLIILNQFVGYPIYFYSAIPFSNLGNNIDSSFKEIVSKIRYLRDAIELVQEYNFSNAISYFINKNLSFIFYLGEVKILSSILNDDNALLLFLESIYAFSFLSLLKSHPKTIEFINDYIALKGVKSFLNLINEKHYRIKQYALEYAAFTQDKRVSEQSFWSMDYPYEHQRHSLPIVIKATSIANCTIDSIDFTLLLSGKELDDIAEVLHDIFLFQSFFDLTIPAIAIKNNNTVVGALRVCLETRKVIDTINFDKWHASTKFAYYKWLKKFDYTEAYTTKIELH